ncbi:MAG: gliding motility-associated C-terminal domain-containing protein [Flavobacteriales bacterium]|nr:gliding motility-associated C-terminal domain-containing protein [Flavobacteriales bacterium]
MYKTLLFIALLASKSFAQVTGNISTFTDGWTTYTYDFPGRPANCDSVLYPLNCRPQKMDSNPVISVNATLGVCGNGQKTASGGPRFSWMTSGFMDPNTDDRLPVCPPGSGPYSLRIGNQEAGYQAECAEKILSIDSSASYIDIQYAVVMEMPEGHRPAQHGHFQIVAFDDAEKEIPGVSLVINGNDLKEQGFLESQHSACGKAWFRFWTHHTMDLRAYAGQRVHLQFCTADCALGSHFTYAYIQYGLRGVESIQDEVPVSMLYVPNAFTPNGDGKNEVFGVEGKNIRTFELYIFDKWGHLVFETNRIDSRWGGYLMNGDEAPASNYLWMIKATGDDGKDYKITGELVLLRSKDH